MQYYIKIFNKKTDELVGYYKETGKTCISKLMNGIKYFDTLEEAFAISDDLDEGFLRDKDGHYYTAHATIYGDSAKQTPQEPKKSKLEKEEELQDELDTFIRKNSSKAERQTGIEINDGFDLY